MSTILHKQHNSANSLFVSIALFTYSAGIASGLTEFQCAYV